MVGNGLTVIKEKSVCFEIFQPSDGLHQCFKDEVFIIHCEYYLTAQNWLLLIGGSFKPHCAQCNFKAWWL